MHVLSTLRLLALPPPAVILLKDEVKNIPEQELDQKLEQFNIVGLTKKRVMEVLEQRCDLVLLEKLIAWFTPFLHPTFPSFYSFRNTNAQTFCCENN